MFFLFLYQNFNMINDDDDHQIIQIIIYSKFLSGPLI
ncbi:hypothetical protein pb186bvf_002036 [Paramecium bursaria]